ncbi:MAG TPA: DUF3137 domain-containing protein [Caulobacteraceae bacterium]
MRLWTVAVYLGLPVFLAVYGFFRGGADGAVGGGFGSLLVETLFMFDVTRLLDWLTLPKKPPRWRHELIYWSVTTVLAAAGLIGVTVLIGGFDPIEEHGFTGWIDGFLAGLVSAGLVGFISARFHTWLMWLQGPLSADTDNPSELQALLAPALAELEAVRQDTGRRIRRRAAWLTPFGAAVMLAAWGLWLLLGGVLSLLAPPIAIVIGGGVGQVVAVGSRGAEYARLFKARVLPALAALFGALTYQRPSSPDLERLRQFHVFGRFDSARSEDEIAGDYRGLKVSIRQLDLWRGWGPTHKRVFQGLLIEVTLKNRLSGTTAIAADAGALGNLLHEMAARKIERVGLESAKFEKDYEVYGTDQVMARALVTPDFMERFGALGEAAGFGKPLALAQDSLLLITLPRIVGSRGVDDFFGPPGYDEPANDDAVLTRLYGDLETMLRATDAVIALDLATSRQAGHARAPSIAGIDD